MVTPQKITEREWKFVESQLEARGLDRHEIEALRGAFFDDLHDVDYGEHQPIFGKPPAGVTPKEMEDTFGELRNPYSPKSKSLKTKLHPAKLDVAEEVFKEAMKGNKGGW